MADKPVKIEDGATVIENRIFRILGRALGYGILVAYAILFIKAKSNGEDFTVDDWEKWMLAVCVIAVFAVELIRAYAKKKTGL